MKCEYISGIDGNTLHTPTHTHPTKSRAKRVIVNIFMAMLIFISIFKLHPRFWCLTVNLMAKRLIGNSAHTHTLELEFQLFSAAYCINLVKRRLHTARLNDCGRFTFFMEIAFIMELQSDSLTPAPECLAIAIKRRSVKPTENSNRNVCTN